MDQSSPQKDAAAVTPPQTGGRWLVYLGLAGTALYLWVLRDYVTTHAVSNLEPDKLGTFIGGAVGPLAFGWLVLGFFQQGVELRHSARALWLQSEELRNSVEQQKALVDITKKQFEYERDERRKAEQEAERLARPNIGVQSNGIVMSGGTRRYEFLLANAGAMVTSVKLTEGSTSICETAAWGPGINLTVAFSFEPGEELRSRNIVIAFNDARGTPTTVTLIFPVAKLGSVETLVAPQSEQPKLVLLT